MHSQSQQCSQYSGLKVDLRLLRRETNMVSRDPQQELHLRHCLRGMEEICRAVKTLETWQDATARYVLLEQSTYSLPPAWASWWVLRTKWFPEVWPPGHEAWGWLRHGAAHRGSSVRAPHSFPQEQTYTGMSD